MRYQILNILYHRMNRFAGLPYSFERMSIINLKLAFFTDRFSISYSTLNGMSIGSIVVKLVLYRILGGIKKMVLSLRNIFTIILCINSVETQRNRAASFWKGVTVQDIIAQVKAIPV